MKIRNAIYAVLAMALVSGCQAPAPSHPVAETARTTHSLREEPLRAAGCIARNIDRYRSPYSARIVPGTAPAIAEVIVAGREGVAVARLFAAGNASTAVIVAEPVHERDALVAAMVEGC